MSMCLFHVLHYGFRKKMLLLNTPTGNEDFPRSNKIRLFLAGEVLKLALDATPSSINEQMWDTPAAATNWLKTFAINNEEILKQTDVE